MATTLWDTTGTDVVKALAAERRAAGALASGLALTLVAVVDDRRVPEAEQAATIAASAHPCRLIMVVRHSINADIRLDAEVQIGGRLGSTEAVVMRMYGRLALHAESVVLPLLAPDAPVVTWWHGAPPAEIATDALGVLANRYHNPITVPNRNCYGHPNLDGDGDGDGNGNGNGNGDSNANGDRDLNTFADRDRNTIATDQGVTERGDPWTARHGFVERVRRESSSNDSLAGEWSLDRGRLDHHRQRWQRQRANSGAGKRRSRREQGARR